MLLLEQVDNKFLNLSRLKPNNISLASSGHNPLLKFLGKMAHKRGIKIGRLPVLQRQTPLPDHSPNLLQHLLKAGQLPAQRQGLVVERVLD
jgi:hypothetical protein